jgi:LysR family nitrogen assimilation transcriptional regulator
VPPASTAGMVIGDFPVDVRQLRYFVKIVEAGSFTKAADHLGIAQPSLGYQIRKLEQELCVQLLVRLSRGIVLTEPGRVLFEEGKRVLAEIATLRQRLCDMSEAPQGQVALGITPSLAGRLLVPLVKRVKDKLPVVSLAVTEGLSSTLIELVEFGRLDLALAYNVAPTRGLHVERLAQEQIWFVYASADGDDDDNSPLSFRELARHALILPSRPHRLRQLAEDAAQHCKIELNVVSEMQSIPTILHLVENRLGTTLLAGGSLTRANDGRLSARPIVDPTLRFDVVLAYADARPLSRAQHLVAALVRESVGAEYPAT